MEKQKKYSIEEWAEHLGISYEEAYEPNVDYIREDGTVVYLPDSLLDPRD